MDKRINFSDLRIDKKNIARALVIVFILMVAFPPYEIIRTNDGMAVSTGFAFIGYLPECYVGSFGETCYSLITKIDILQLIGQFLIAIMIAIGVFFGFKSER
jgi:hypothetical protein